MVRLTKIYTRGGDKGQTSLGNGDRISKHTLRVEAYGTVDEANAVVGLARLHTSGEDDQCLAIIQNELFDLGADLCRPVAAGEQGGLRIVPSQIDRLEREIDAMNAALAPLTSFILPAGAPAAAHLHFGRTVVRRAERLVVALCEAEPDGVNPLCITYLNRLSDHFFVLARRLNGGGMQDVLWVAGAGRT